MLFDSKRRQLAATDFARRSLRLCAAAVGVAAGLVASPACAQVMDIAPDGAISVRQGSGAATWQVVSPSPASTDDDAGAPAVPQVAVTTANSALVPQQYSAAIAYAAASANISPSLLAALVWQESRWNAQAVSRKGAIGLAQLMPGTARDLGVNPADPAANLISGARYLRYLLDEFDGDVEKALAAYNGGSGTLQYAVTICGANWLNCLPGETRHYIYVIMGI